MTDPLANYRKPDKSLNPSAITEAYIVTGSDDQPLILCVLTPNGWMEITPVDPKLVEELVVLLGRQLDRYSLQGLFHFSKQKQADLEAALKFIDTVLKNVPTFKK